MRLLRSGSLLAALVVPIWASESATPAQAAPLNILWDDVHDEDGDELTGNFSEFRSLVLGEGHSITELNAGLITPAALAGVDLLMIFDAELAPTAAEVTAIHDFIAGGGYLFYVGENSGAFSVSGANAVLAPYGISFTGVNIGDLNDFASHPLTAGLTTVTFGTGGELGVAGPGTMVLGRTAPGGSIGYAFGAGGAVVVLGDSNAIDDGALAPGNDNERLVLNMLDHFQAVPEPSSLVLVSLGALAGLGWLRRRPAAAPAA